MRADDMAMRCNIITLADGRIEFISADTGENIFFSYEILYGLYKMADVSIAFYMSEMVVDVF